ncbi:MAG: AAA family ATPase [Alphaproteobacteria bacterium]
MAKSEKPPLKIHAEHIGPILSLDVELTANKQNLILARNGTGKSFLARSFRYLDLHSQGETTGEAAQKLVSDEATNGRGSFQCSIGDEVFGKIELNRIAGTADPNVDGKILHVFTEDYIHEQLRTKKYEIDGNIDGTIDVGRENIKLKDKKKQKSILISETESFVSDLTLEFSVQKTSQLKVKAFISANMGIFSNLNIEQLLTQYSKKPSQPEINFATICNDIKSIKDLPTNPDFPTSIQPPNLLDLDLESISSSLSKITSPSTVAEKLKKKIEKHSEFYAQGVKIVEEHAETCPFCEQDMKDEDTIAIMESYFQYFQDAEQQHKRQLSSDYKKVVEKEDLLSSMEKQVGSQIRKFDFLKKYVPSLKTRTLGELNDEISDLRQFLQNLKKQIESKGKDLTQTPQIDSNSLTITLNRVLDSISENNNLCGDLTTNVGRLSKERLALQKQACEVFAIEFTRDKWSDFEKVHLNNTAEKDLEAEIHQLEQSGPSASVKMRVAQTFKEMLHEFFGSKYGFDNDDFTLTREGSSMRRGADATLSDGEKSVLAFCYFIANIHQKVKLDSDYGKLFIVFDDPVSSMSYDYVYTVAQTLKNLNVSDKGVVSVNPHNLGKGSSSRPNLLVLTHSNYFFNLLQSNKIVESGGSFQLQKRQSTHTLKKLDKYVSYFIQHLEDVYKVAKKGEEPSHTTGNSIRALLEAVGRFCRPDKVQLTEFLSYLMGKEKFGISSVLINTLSHGTYAEYCADPEDLKKACREAIKVIERYAPGQLKVSS